MNWFNNPKSYQIIKRLNYSVEKEYLLVKQGKIPKTYFLKKVTNNKCLFKFAKNEIDILNSSKHPNIVSVHDYNIHEDLIRTILVIPYFEHGDLFNYAIIRQETIDYFHVFKQLLDVLLYLKQNEIVHRDVSLENIMIKSVNSINSINQDKLEIVLIDFEYAIYLDDLHTENPYKGIIGKRNYIPPELSLHNVKKQKFGYGSDMWSLGNCFFTLLTKKYLFNSSKEYFYMTVDDTFLKNRLEKNIKNINDSNTINVIMTMLQ
jgi:serine/threonine protein kinase